MTWRWVASALGGTIIGGVIGGLFGWQIYDRDVPVTVSDERVLNPIVPPGDVAQIQFKFFRQRSCYTTAYQEWRGPTGRRWPLPQRVFFAGLLPLGDDTVILEVPVPLDAKNGELCFESVNTYGCNFVARFIWPVTAPARKVCLKVDDTAPTTALPLPSYLRAPP